MRKTFIATIISLGIVVSQSPAGTITISATGLSSSPIFVTTALQSIAVGTELNIGTFASVSALTATINTYKAGVTGTGFTLAEAQTDGATKRSLLYSQTLSWLQSASNFTSIVSGANSIT